MKALPLILAPFSTSSQRQLWLSPIDIPESKSKIEFKIQQQSHETFSFIITLLNQLYNQFPSYRDSIQALLSQVRTVSDSQSEDFALSDSNFTADAVQFAVLRRISRESVYTATVIDQVAKELNRVLCGSEITDAIVQDFDEIDRPSLKILCRAVLLLPNTEKLKWHWGGGDVSRSIYLENSELATKSTPRSNLLKQIFHVIIKPQVNYPPLYQAKYDTSMPVKVLKSSKPKNVLDISRALVMQNYDGCFHWAEELHDCTKDPQEKSESLRLLSLSAVNTGSYIEAISYSEQAEIITSDPVTKAKICYMAGLIYAKRLYNSNLALTQYEKGMRYLEQVPKTPEVLVEQAWLKNGIALLNALSWKKTKNDDDYQRAFALVNEAFWLISELENPASAYLRFNLLANAAFLMEMRGDYNAAISVFENVFERFALRDQQSARGQMTINYRMAGLRMRAKDFNGAFLHISRVIEADEVLSCPFMADHVKRLIGYYYFMTQNYNKAYFIFKEGLDITYAARLGSGLISHVTGVISTLIALGKYSEINYYFDMLNSLGLDEHVVDIKDKISKNSCTPLSPLWKLPAYIPEVDLEDIPVSNLNKQLVNPAIA
ncbi:MULTISPECIES: hypothetical protein [unclassified Rahnella]|uniref:hypothetical protein n=1 Tax=unclassified Rahnella TaxID=2635087 RepID=UPI001297651C|nr:MULTISPECIES: hypothetical protein [unclassified Rahnella]MCM2446905.1 hypothetical protein [Rahnella sp. CG8]MQB55278.1 hypothetical protein [Rahnella sp. RcJ3]